MKKIIAIILCVISIVSILPFGSFAATAPEKPDGFFADAVTAESVNLSWLPTSGATGYRVYTYLEGKWKIVKDTTDTTVTVTGLDSLKTYIFAVRSAAKIGSKTVFCNGYSYIKVKTKGLVTPTLYGEAGVNYVSLSWDKVPGACGYAVYQHINGSWQRIGTPTRKKTSGVVKNLKSSQNYYFGIRAYTYSDDGLVFSKASNVLKVKTLDSNKVTVKCAAVSDSAAKLTWNKADDATGYRIYKYENGSWNILDNVYGVSNNSYIVRNLESDSKYYFRVRAFSKKGTSVKWYSPSDICTVVTDPGVRDVYVHRVEALRPVFESDNYTFEYDNVTRKYGTVPVTIARNYDSFYLYTKVNEMPYALLNQDEENSFILLEEIESYIKVPALFGGYIDVKSTMQELLPGEDWTAKANVVTFNSQRVVCESYINPEKTKMLKFYFKTDELIAIDEIGVDGIEARALIKSITASSDPSLFTVPETYSKLFFGSLDGLLGINL